MKLGIIMNAEGEPIEKSYPRLFDTMAEILFRHDPLDINFEHNADEYHPEVSTIMPRLKSATSENEVLQIIHEEFIKWFDEDMAGPKEKYADSAREIWSAWRNFKAGD
jgi:hypothetical protein